MDPRPIPTAIDTKISVEVFLLDFVPGEGALVERVFVPSPGGDPTDLALRIIDQRRGNFPRFCYSSSWRYEAGSVVLTYLALLPASRLTGPLRLSLRLLATEEHGRPDDPRRADLDRIAVIAHCVRDLAFRVGRGERPVRGVTGYVRDALAEVVSLLD